MVFHSPQLSQRPAHFENPVPQLWQTKVSAAFAIFQYSPVNVFQGVWLETRGMSKRRGLAAVLLIPDHKAHQRDGENKTALFARPCRLRFI